MGEIEKIEEKIVNILNKYFDLQLVYLFGSSITDRFNFESDIDIAYLSSDKLLNDKEYNKKYIEAKLELIRELGREIDLIDLKNAGIPIIKEVIYKGKKIYMKNEKVKEEYEYRYAALYNQYNEDIDIIKKKIKERGYISYAGDNTF
jgi:predicted nucleotidyltransferase